MKNAARLLGGAVVLADRYSQQLLKEQSYGVPSASIGLNWQRS
jgi:hypothetical protein